MRRFDDNEPTTAAGCGCRSCATVMVADCFALGFCPCAVVSLLSLALVKAPLVVSRHCVERLRRRRRMRMLLHKKRVRDVAADASSATTVDVREKVAKEEVGVVVETTTRWREVLARTRSWRGWRRCAGWGTGALATCPSRGIDL